MIAVVDSGGANIASVLFALERLGVKGILTSDPDTIINADHVILPGVGAAGTTMAQLRTNDLIDCLKSLTQPVLGICLGMQLLFTRSDEGNTDMLGIIDGTVTKFNKKSCAIIPHMGWNTVSFNKPHPLTKDVKNKSYFYFVHSYRAGTGDYTIGETDYGLPFSAVAAQDNFMGCQFHPERSGNAGAQLLKNFMGM